MLVHHVYKVRKVRQVYRVRQFIKCFCELDELDKPDGLDDFNVLRNYTLRKLRRG